MIELVLESRGKILGIKVRRRLSEHDFADVLVPHLDWIIQEHGKGKLLFSMEGDVQDPDPGSPWEAKAFGTRYGDDIEKLAVAGSGSWAEWGTQLSAHFAKIETKVFSPGEWDQALDWLTG